MAGTEPLSESENWEIKFREDEEMEFFTELALHETERWIQAVTRRKFLYPDDPRKSLEDGILLCELLNSIKNCSVKRINRQAAPIAGLDNLNVFLIACRSEFGLSETQLFDPADLEDLSQRAIAESDHLKQESDRRLRNVAITIYWLGRAVSQNYQTPSLDFSAFTPLINHNAKDIISNEHIYKLDSSWNCYDYSSAYGSNIGISGSSLKHSYENYHNRDSSYESYASYGKGSEDSLDEQAFNNMPVGRISNMSTRHDGARYSVSNDSVYREDRHNGMYRSSPDLGVPSFNHRRSSSTDSLDGSYRDNHSRQSSDSCDGYPTRSGSRRISTSNTDPLQFIKNKGAEDMAKTAAEQIKLLEEDKRIKTISTETAMVKEEDDWQSSLGDWKSRRKSRSDAFTIKEEMEDMMKQKEEEERTSKTNSTQKSFKQIQEDRERRKSAGAVRSFYPFEENDDDDDEDNDAFISPIKPSTVESSFSSFSKLTSSTPSHITEKITNVASWAEDSESGARSGDNIGPESDDKNNNQPLDNKTKDKSDISQSNNKKHNISHNIHNNNNKDYYSNDTKNVSSRFTGDVSESKGLAEHVSRQNMRNNVSQPSNKINHIRSRFESPEDKPVTQTAVFDAKVNLKDRKKTFENLDQSNESDVGKPPKPYPRERNHVTATSSVYSSSKFSGKDYVEKNIKITSKHNSQGFGFTITGGADKKQPISVERVSLGSAADVCELKSKDEILAINKTHISHVTKNEANDLIKESSRRGQVEIRVKRLLDSNVEDSDEFLSSEDEEEEVVKKEDQLIKDTRSLDSSIPQGEDKLLLPVYNNNTTEKNTLQQVISTTYDYTDQPLMNQLKNDASLLIQLDPHNDSSYQSAENVSQSYSSYTSSRNPSSLDNSDYVNTTQPSYINTSTSSYSNTSNPAHTEPTNYVRNRDNHHDYVNTSNLDSWGYNDNQESEVVMRRKNKVDDSVASSSSLDDIDRVKSPDLGSSDSDGPPAILRKWQRQRPKSEYRFQDEKPLINQKRLSATLPWQPENRGIVNRPDDPVLERPTSDFKETVNSQPVPSPRSNQFNTREDRKRIEEWNNQQEQIRKPDDVNAVVASYTFDEAEFENNRAEMQKQYEEEQKRAADIQQRQQQQEQELLEPEMERMRQLEERKQQRRKRLQELHQDNESIKTTESGVSNYQDVSCPISASHSSRHSEISESKTTMSYSTPQHHTYQNVYEPNYVNQPTSIQSTMNVHVTNSRSLPTGDSNSPAMSFTLPSNQSSGLIIDPRNRIEDSEPIPQYSIQLNLNQQETPQTVNQSASRSISEQEREKIQKEYENFDELLHQQQEDSRFREREEKLRQQEERLRMDEERLRQEEQNFVKERQNFLNQSAEFIKSSNEPKIHQSVPTKVRGKSAIYKSTVATPSRSESQPTSYSTSMVIENNRNSRYNIQKVNPSWPPSNKLNHPGNISRSNDKWQSGGRTSDNKTSNSANKLSKDWPPQDNGSVQSSKSHFSQHTEVGKLRSLSREDMLAMNRKATPLHSKPDNASSPTSPTTTGAIKRETPTRQEIHSLNAVPKPKLRQSVDWIGKSEQVPDRRANPRHSDFMKNQHSNPQDHWLIEEAERRRMNSDLNMKSSTLPIQPGLYNGPIKPPRDPGNMWSDTNSRLSSNQQRTDPNMPMQIRQTLLQKTASARGSNGSSYSPELNSSVPQISRNTNMSQTMPASYGYNSPQIDYGSHHPISHAPTQTNNASDQGPISGKQLCSSCHEELGFGAAMIIEKLGLFYHMPCFKCCVCRTPLGNGIDGADVRIRVNKLHCPNCYSNDEGISSME